MFDRLFHQGPQCGGFAMTNSAAESLLVHMSACTHATADCIYRRNSWRQNSSGKAFLLHVRVEQVDQECVVGRVLGRELMKAELEYILKHQVGQIAARRGHCPQECMSVYFPLCQHNAVSNIFICATLKSGKKRKRFRCKFSLYFSYHEWGWGWNSICFVFFVSHLVLSFAQFYIGLLGIFLNYL